MEIHSDNINHVYTVDVLVGPTNVAGVLKHRTGRVESIKSVCTGWAFFLCFYYIFTNIRRATGAARVQRAPEEDIGLRNGGVRVRRPGDLCVRG